MNTFQKINEEISNDAMNEKYTKQQMQPIYMANPHAKILIIGQAPGLKSQQQGIVFKDKSGDTLRRWLGVDEDCFYNSGLFAVLPLDFYYPGKGKSTDLSPRKGFADKWHPPLLALMPNIQLTILIGRYAQKYYLQDKVQKNLTQTLLAYEQYLPQYFVLVHPSPLNFRWFKKNPTFDTNIVPALRKRVENILSSQ